MQSNLIKAKLENVLISNRSRRLSAGESRAESLYLCSASRICKIRPKNSFSS